MSDAPIQYVLDYKKHIYKKPRLETRPPICRGCSLAKANVRNCRENQGENKEVSLVLRANKQGSSSLMLQKMFLKNANVHLLKSIVNSC